MRRMIFEVGKQIPQLRGIAEGPRFTCDGSGFLLLDARELPTQAEVQQFRAGPVFRYGLCEAEGLSFFLYKAGDLPWNDVPILPVADPSAAETTLTAVLLDCVTGIVCAIRALGLDDGFVRAWRTAVTTMRQRESSQAEINRKIDKVYATLTTEQMVQMIDEIYEVRGSKSRENAKPDGSNSVRRSLADLPEAAVHKDNYRGLPQELQEFNYWIVDSGRCVMAVPETLLPEAEAAGDLDLYEVPIPVKYVLEKGYRLYRGHVIVEAGYDPEIGLVIPEGYEEW